MSLFFYLFYFNSHPHEEDDGSSLARCGSHYHFNSHPHEEDDNSETEDAYASGISTHILTKRMTPITSPSCIASDISTHILTKRMTRRLRPSVLAIMHFNSHPHEEDDRTFVSLFHHDIFISTHILTKRMTVIPVSMSVALAISTHILTKRMTCLYPIGRPISGYFNSHPHEEDDGYVYRVMTFHLKISTHILTKRMTHRPLLSCTIQYHFNSHPHEEDDSNFKQNLFI